MGGGPTVHLHVEGDTLLHRLPAQVKLVGLLALAAAALALPSTAPWAFAVTVLVAVTVIVSTRVPLRHIAPRLVVEVPFVVFALVLPFVATGPRVVLGPWSVSAPGLTGAWVLLARSLVGVLAAIAFATTTTPRDLVRGLQALRVPDQLVTIVAAMVRYLSVVGGEMGRMRVARESRGFRASSVRAWPALAASAGALFLRSYERGERVHLAMLSRGYAGRLPDVGPLRARGADWVIALAPAALVAALSVLARAGGGG